jgi:PAS domain S-box-containing protein
MDIGNEATDELLALKAQLEELRTSFQEANEVVHAITWGEVDAVVVRPPEQEHAVYTFFGADHPYRMLVESMNEGAVTLANDGTILYCNSSFARIVQTEKSILAGTSFAQYVHQGDASRFQAFLSQERDDRAEMTLVASNKADVPVYLSRSAADLVGSRGICLVVTDLTEQRKHDDVVASERLARSILDRASEAIVICDSSGRVTHASRQAAVLAGGNPLLKHFEEAFDFVLPENHADGRDAENERRLLHEAACGNRSSIRREVACTRADGEHLQLLLSSSPLQDKAGDGLGAVMILADITEAKRAAAALEESERQSMKMLEQRVAERTAELSRANYMLTQLNREMQDFAFLASHDLQEPLRKIHTFLDLLVDELGDAFTPKAQDYLRRITSAARRMSDLIRALLEYSRVTSRGDAFRQVDLSEALADALLGLKPVLEEADCRVEAGELPTIEADPGQIRRLFSHLVANAAKFCRPDVPPIVKIRAVTPDDDHAHLDGVGESIRLEFEDNGVGINERYLDRIFSPFQQLHGRGAYDGIGMGLAICRRIVERHYGTIQAHSDPGQGSTLIVTLPVKHPSRGA